MTKTEETGSIPLSLQNFISVVQQATDRSGEIIRAHFTKRLTVEWKKDNTPVTMVDREVERQIREVIRSRYPNARILGEEFGWQDSSATESFWIIDPIDGTKSLISGVPLFGTLMGVVQNQQPIFGAIHLPISGDLVVGDNRQCLWNGEPTRMRAIARLEEATLLCTDHRPLEKEYPGFPALTRRVNLYRTWGDCFGYFLLATGFADIMLDAAVAPWDSLPIIPIIRGAGGEISDLMGEDPVTGHSLIAARSEWRPVALSYLHGDGA